VTTTTTRAVARLLRHAQTTAPDDVVSTLVEGARLLGGCDVVLYLVDYEQQHLQPTPDRLDHGEPVHAADVEGTMAGRCFRTQAVLESARDDAVQVWAPVTERSARLGVLALTVRELDDAGRELCEELGLLAAQLVLTASAYCDRFHLQRRRQELSLAAEMQWSLLPPLTFAYDGTTIAGLLEPAYDVGGDCFDYAMNGRSLEVGVFDAMGHGLPSSVTAGLAVGAYRHSRRTAADLAGRVTAMDVAVEGVVGDGFATALLARLDVHSGRLSWISAGHPAPIVARHGSVLPDLEQEAAFPLGLGLVQDVESLHESELSLQPGDHVLLYTDGVIEARSADGEEFGVERLSDLFVRESGSGLMAAEILRRLVQSCLDFQSGPLRDDATLVLIEWAHPTSPVGPQRLS
jgi:serine phosphatase RsbU (regulator of sigma subunit)